MWYKNIAGFGLVTKHAYRVQENREEILLKQPATETKQYISQHKYTKNAK